jgi:membrane-bound serine protease (ClpP class)
VSARARFVLGAVLFCLPAAAAAEIPVVDLSGVVHAVSSAHVIAGLDRADASGAPLVVIRMDTPGGLESAMRPVVDRILNGKTPVAVFVGPSGARAASAGFIIAMAADVVAMAPGTNMGAAHPVSAIGGGVDEVMSKKAAQDMAAYVRSKAAQRGRDAALAEKAVLESRSFTEKEALEARLADLVVHDVAELVRALEGREVKRFDGTTTILRLAGQQTADFRMGWRQRVLATVATPEVLFLLLLGALAGIGAELSHPGAIFPGVLGALCLILFLFAAQVIPVNWAGVLLILLAIGLFVAEVKVASYGLLTLGGLVAMILGAMMLVDAPGPEWRVPLRLLLPAAVVTAAGSVLLVRLVIRAQRRKPVTGREGLLGRAGLADGDLAPEGWVRVMGERWRGIAEGEVKSGERVVVVGMDGLVLRVRKGA